MLVKGPENGLRIFGRCAPVVRNDIGEYSGFLSPFAHGAARLPDTSSAMTSAASTRSTGGSRRYLRHTT